MQGSIKLKKTNKKQCILIILIKVKIKITHIFLHRSNYIFIFYKTYHSHHDRKRHITRPQVIQKLS